MSLAFAQVKIKLLKMRTTILSFCKQSCRACRDSHYNDKNSKLGLQVQAGLEQPFLSIFPAPPSLWSWAQTCWVLFLAHNHLYESLLCCCDRLPWPRQFKKEYVVSWFQRDKGPSWQGGMRQQVAGLATRASGWEPTVLNESPKKGKQTRNGTRLSLKSYTPTPQQWCTSSSQAVPSKPSQTMPPIGDLMFKCRRLWGTFSFFIYIFNFLN